MIMSSYYNFPNKYFDLKGGTISIPSRQKFTFDFEIYQKKRMVSSIGNIEKAIWGFQLSGQH